MGKKQGDKFEVGDDVFVPGLGWSKVVKDDGSDYLNLKWILGARAIWFDENGEAYGNKIAYHANQGIIQIDTNEPVKLELDQPIWGWDSEKWIHGHFKERFFNGVKCFADGMTSHTSNGAVELFKIWRTTSPNEAGQ